jgi:hypothetical protein
VKKVLAGQRIELLKKIAQSQMNQMPLYPVTLIKGAGAILFPVAEHLASRLAGTSAVAKAMTLEQEIGDMVKKLSTLDLSEAERKLLNPIYEAVMEANATIIVDWDGLVREIGPNILGQESLYEVRPEFALLMQLIAAKGIRIAPMMTGASAKKARNIAVGLGIPADAIWEVNDEVNGSELVTVVNDIRQKLGDAASLKIIASPSRGKEYQEILTDLADVDIVIVTAELGKPFSVSGINGERLRNMLPKELEGIRYEIEGNKVTVLGRDEFTSEDLNRVLTEVQTILFQA